MEKREPRYNAGFPVLAPSVGPAGEQLLRGTEEGPGLVLVCKACGFRARYHVGTVGVDPERLVEGKGNVRDLTASPFAFTRYFRCLECDASGPWSVPEDTSLALLVMAATGLLGRRRGPVAPLRLQLFDGTRVSTCAEGIDCLQRKIEAAPDDPFLLDRMGNLYRTGGRFDLALAAYERALELDPDFVLCLHSAAVLLSDQGRLDEAAGMAHRFLNCARAEVEKARLGIEDLMKLTRDVLDILIELNVKTDGRIRVVPAPATGALRTAPGEPLVLHTRSFDLSSDEEWDRFVALFLGLDEHRTARSDDGKSRRRRRRKRG